MGKIQTDCRRTGEGCPYSWETETLGSCSQEDRRRARGAKGESLRVSISIFFGASSLVFQLLEIHYLCDPSEHKRDRSANRALNSAKDFHNGLAYVVTKDGEHGYIVTSTSLGNYTWKPTRQSPD